MGFLCLPHPMSSSVGQMSHFLCLPLQPSFLPTVEEDGGGVSPVPSRERLGHAGMGQVIPLCRPRRGKGCPGSFPPGETITGVILESEPREGPSNPSITSGLGGYFPPAGFMGAEEGQGTHVVHLASTQSLTYCFWRGISHGPLQTRLVVVARGVRQHHCAILRTGSS